MTEKEALIALAAFTAFGPVKVKLLRENLGDAQKVWRANIKDFRELGLSEKITGEFNEFRKKFDLETYSKNLAKLGVEPLTIDEESYPERLKQIVDPPVVLYVRGNLLPQDDIAVAVVGSRKITSYGQTVTAKIAGELAARGVTIISGLAIGVDGIAHTSALDNLGRTLAVIGSGVDVIYPPSHTRLAGRIIESGAIISEYPLGSPALPMNFPYRNRIISGLSLGVVVIEGTEKSGTLLTAAHAAVQGRDVFAVPGPITSVTSQAPNLLIKQGAKMVTCIDDILEELDISRRAKGIEQRTVLPETEEELIILELLEREELSADAIMQSVKLDTRSVLATLTTMELKGLIKNTQGVYGKI